MDDISIKPIKLPNNNYPLYPNLGIKISLAISVLEQEAEKIHNGILGHYFADQNGAPISGVIDLYKSFETNIEIVHLPSNIPSSSAQIGFFFIPEGSILNDWIVSGNHVTFFYNGELWKLFFDSKELSSLDDKLFFSDSNLNWDKESFFSISNKETEKKSHFSISASCFLEYLNEEGGVEIISNISTKHDQEEAPDIIEDQKIIEQLLKSHNDDWYHLIKKVLSEE